MTLKQFIPKAVIICCLATTSHGLEIDNFTQQKNERFKNDVSFAGFGLDLSGIGRDKAGHWATLISPNVFISSQHFRPTGTLSFYENNTSTTTAVTRNIATATRIGLTDLYIGCLDSPVSPNIKHYDFATSTAGLGPNTIAFQAGAPDVDKSGQHTGFPNSLNMVLGLNKLHSITTKSHDVSSGTVIRTAREAVPDINNVSIYDPLYTTHEALVQDGDSGSPLFIADSANKVTILGTAWYRGRLNSTISRDTSVYTFTGAYDKEINDYVAQHVPEPSTSLLLGVSCSIFILRRKK